MHDGHCCHFVSKPVIVLGVGDALRSDAGVGRYVFERLASIDWVAGIADIAYTSVDVRLFDLHTYPHVILVAAAHDISQPIMYIGAISEFARRASPLIRAFPHGSNDVDMHVSGWLIPVSCTDIGITLSRECQWFADDVIAAIQERLVCDSDSGSSSIREQPKAGDAMAKRGSHSACTPSPRHRRSPAATLPWLHGRAASDRNRWSRRYHGSDSPPSVRRKADEDERTLRS